MGKNRIFELDLGTKKGGRLSIFVEGGRRGVGVRDKEEEGGGFDRR